MKQQPTPQDNINKAIYYKAFFAFGLLPLLLILQTYEDDENFTECLAIKLAIDEVNATYNESFHTRFGSDAINQIRVVWEKDGRDFTAYYNLLPRDVDKVLHFVKASRATYGLTSIKNDIKNILNL